MQPYQKQFQRSNTFIRMLLLLLLLYDAICYITNETQPTTPIHISNAIFALHTTIDLEIDSTS